MSRSVEIARRWVGTPYHHQASVRGAGCDCLGLILGIARELRGDLSLTVPPYTPDWAREQGRETLLDGLSAHLLEVTTAQVGDVLAFRLRPDLPVTHLGILSTPDSFLHAYSGRCVAESVFIPFWRRRHSHTFRFQEPAS